MKKMNQIKKREIRCGTFPLWWNIGILISVVVSSLVSLIQGGVQVAAVANPNKQSDQPSSRNMYNPSYYSSNMFVRLHKYPSKSNISFGV